MDATIDRLRALLAPAVEGAGLLLEDLTVHHAGAHSRLRVVVDLPEDDPGELDLDRVARVTTAVSDALDEGDALPGTYQLEVSSPGVDRPLREHRHFVRARGRRVRLVVRDGSTLVGRLVEVGPAEIVVAPIEPPRKGRPPVELPAVQVPLADIASGQVEVDLAALRQDEDEDAEG